MNESLIDFDFNSAPSEFSQGSLPESDEQREQFCSGRYGDIMTPIPRAEWKDALEETSRRLRRHIFRVHNQGSEGSCVSHGTTNCIEIKLAQTVEQDEWLALSPISLYARIGRSPSSGAMISDGMKFTSVAHDGYGVLPLSEGRGLSYPHHFQERGFHDAKRYLNANPGWEITGKRFRANWYIVDSDEEYVTAMAQGDPILVGRKGHSICYPFGTWYRNAPMACYVNSWLNWGDPINDNLRHGLGYDSPRLWGRGYACRAVIVP